MSEVCLIRHTQNLMMIQHQRKEHDIVYVQYNDIQVTKDNIQVRMRKGSTRLDIIVIVTSHLRLISSAILGINT